MTRLIELVHTQCQSTHLLTCCTSDTLTLSKLDNNFLVVTEIPSQPREFLRDAVQLFSGEMRSKGIAWSTKVGQGFATYNVDWMRTE